MKLLASQTSPYARKLRVLAAELELDMTLVETAPMADDAALLAVNPLGKVPVLITDSGDAIFDSSVISSYLLALAPGNALLPPGQDAHHGWHWIARTTEAIADGIIDAVIIKRFNTAQGVTRGEWLDRQQRAIDRSLAALANRIGGDFDFAMLCSLIACEYLDLRWPEIDWRQQQPMLAAAQARFTDRSTMIATRPQI